MIEMLMGNWFSITRILMNVNELGFMLFGMAYQFAVGFAVIEVITGVFINETFKVANLDDGIMMNEARRAQKAQTKKIDKFFREADEDGNGMLEKEEFAKVLQNNVVQEWLSAMGLDLKDVDKMFELLDVDGDGVISAEEMVVGADALKGPAKAMDMAIMRGMLENMQKQIDSTPQP